MSCTMNGHAMSIGYGEAGTIAETLAIGRNYCHRHISQIPKLSREQLIRLGCVFPRATAPLPHRPKKEERIEPKRPITPEEVARILAGYDAGRSVTAIAMSVHRATSAVRRVLIEHGRDTLRFAGNPGPMRARIVELLHAGKPAEEIAKATGATLSYVRNVASNLRRASAAERKEAS